MLDFLPPKTRIYTVTFILIAFGLAVYLEYVK